MNSPLFSVIIPHKDTPDLLIRALKSIPDNDNIEVIIVDNSNIPFDRSLYNDISRNVSIIYSNPERGAGYARNVGISVARGKWLLFLDADDFYIPLAFKYYYLASNSKSEIIYFKMRSCYSDSYQPAKRGNIYNRLVDDFINKCSDAENRIRYEYVSPCAKMILRELVKKEKIKFDEVPASNDVMFSVKLGHHAKNISAYDQYVYCATVLKGSLTNTNTLKAIESRYLVYLRRNQYLKQIGKAEYQWSTLGFLLKLRKYGIKPIIKFIVHTIQYKNNILIGYRNWLRTYNSLNNKIHID